MTNNAMSPKSKIIETLTFNGKENVTMVGQNVGRNCHGLEADWTHQEISRQKTYTHFAVLPPNSTQMGVREVIETDWKHLKVRTDFPEASYFKVLVILSMNWMLWISLHCATRQQQPLKTSDAQWHNLKDLLASTSLTVSQHSVRSWYPFLFFWGDSALMEIVGIYSS